MIAIGTVLIGAGLSSAIAALQPGIHLTPPSDAGAFGALVKFLPNGNFVVVDPTAGAARNGAVHLYRADGVLISTVRGGASNDAVGSGGIVVLADGNFVISSPCWADDGPENGGAITWVDGARGLDGAVSSDNSVAGLKLGGSCGYSAPTEPEGILALPDGDYVVADPIWGNDGSAYGKGAVTWLRGGSPASGTVSSTNSLVGTRIGDAIGASLTLLANGNVVVGSPLWSSDTAMNVGAATLLHRDAPATGVISAANSLVGSSQYDNVGSIVVALANDNYVVANPYWTRGGISGAGAVTWADGETGVSGLVSEANSLVGSHEGDAVGSNGVTALTNGNYVVASVGWSSDTAQGVSAATWVDGSVGIVGEVTIANSLTGSKTGDGQDAFEIAALANGNYVVSNPDWDNGNLENAGSVTWADGTHGLVGTVSVENSLVGTYAGEGVGDVTPLSNGNYVVAVPHWDSDTGAVQWADGSRGVAGEFSASNAITGARSGDQTGRVFALSDGNYVISTPQWSDGTHAAVGAVTWADGTRETAATISAANSLVGSHDGDQVGSCDGDLWWCPRITPLPDGSYLISSSSWDDDSQADVGAITWLAGHGSYAGTVSPQNSLVGSTAYDSVGDFSPAAFSDGTYILYSPGWNEGATIGVGAVTPGHVGSALSGTIGSANSVIGTPSQSNTLSFDYDPVRHRLLVGDPQSRVVTLIEVDEAPRRGHSVHARPAR